MTSIQVREPNPALDAMAMLVLEDGQRWGEVAEPWQWRGAERMLNPGGKSYNWFGRPRGASKTSDNAGIVLSWMAALASPDGRAYCCAVDRSQAGLLLSAAQGFIRRTPGWSEIFDVQQYRIIHAGGSRLTVLAADSASAYGLIGDLFLCDEVAAWPTTTNGLQMWEAVVSTIPKRKNAKLAVLTTAGAPSHWSYKYFLRAKQGGAWHLDDIPGPVPWIGEEALDEQRAILSEAGFRRLHQNEWVEGDDQLISAADLEAACCLEGPIPPQADKRYVAALDIGLVNDRTAFLIGHLENIRWDGAIVGKRVVVDQLIVWEGTKAQPVDLERVEDTVAAYVTEYRAKLRFDPHQAAHLTQGLARRGIRSEEHIFTPTTNSEMAMALHNALRQRRVWVPNDQRLRNELARVRLKESSPNVYRLDHDRSEHDDMAVVLGMVVYDLLAGAPAHGHNFLEYMKRLADPDTEPYQSTEPLTGWGSFLQKKTDEALKNRRQHGGPFSLPR